jgi:hypothetical protein
MYEIARFDAPARAPGRPETKGAPLGGPLNLSGCYRLPVGGDAGFGISLRGNFPSLIAAW